MFRKFKRRSEAVVRKWGGVCDKTVRRQRWISVWWSNLIGSINVNNVQLLSYKLITTDGRNLCQKAIAMVTKDARDKHFITWVYFLQYEI